MIDEHDQARRDKAERKASQKPFYGDFFDQAKGDEKKAQALAKEAFRNDPEVREIILDDVAARLYAELKGHH